MSAAARASRVIADDPAGVAAVALDPAATGDVAIFAVGHMLPAFALLLVAAGVGLLLEEDPPRIAYWLACVASMGIYLGGTRTYPRAGARIPHAWGPVLLIATFALGWLQHELTAHAYLWLLAGWVVLASVVRRASPASAPAVG